MAKPALTRQAYIDTALTLISEAGVEKLSMRKVASALDVSPMAMYKHFPNKNALLSATLDELIKRADVYPDTDLPWPQWIEHIARGMYAALCNESSWVPVLGSLQLGAQATSVTESFIVKLSKDGFSLPQAMQAYFSVIQTVIGAVCLNTAIKQHQLDAQGLPAITPSLPQQNHDKAIPIPQELQQIIHLDQLEISLPLLIESLQLRLQHS